MSTMDANRPTEQRPLLIKSDIGTARSSRKRRCCGFPWVIEPLIVLYMVTEGPTKTVVQQFVYRAVAQSIFPHNYTINFTDQPCSGNVTPEVLKIKAQVASWEMYQSVGEDVIGLFSLFMMGALCDRFGRRIALLLPPVGDILYLMLFILIVKFKLNVSFILFSFVRNIFGHISVFLVGCFSFVADTTDEQSRSFRMTLIQVLFYVSQCASQIAIGHLVRYSGFLWPFVIALIMKALAFLYTLFIVPETLQTEKNLVYDGAARGRTVQFSWSGLLNGFRFIVRNGERGKKWYIWIILLVYIFFYTFYAENLFSLYVLGSPYCWGPVKFGDYNGISLITYCMGALLCTRILRRWLSDGLQGSLGALSGTLLFFYWFFIREEIMYYFIPVVGIFSYVLIPVSKSILSKLVRHDEQGSTLALYAIVQNVCSVVNSLVVYQVYRQTEQILDGHLPLLITGCLRAIGLVLMLFYTIKTNTATKENHLEKV